jgi:tetratricopeptide (TPR) repeat protein
VSPANLHAPREVDAAERAQLLKAIVLFGGPCFIMLGALWYFLVQKDVISSRLALVLTVLDVPLALLGAIAIHAAVGRGSGSFVNLLYAWGSSTPPARAYPRQETLIIRGQYAEAAEYYRDYIRVTPDDMEARLRLARLLEQHLKDDAAAEQVYLELRRLAQDRNDEFAASNGLIDLYRRAKRTDRLRVELARFAERYKGSAAATAAARELSDLKAGDTAAAT